MTIGIYSLYWEIPDKVYIGQSISIETRYSRHIWAMQRGIHDNYKIQHVYDSYGVPSLNVLEICLKSELDNKEKSYIYEFDSIHSGLNICGVQESRSGIEGTNSKYTKIQLLLVFRKLRDYTISYENISKLYGVGGSTIRSIAMGTQHTWLHTKYPNIWKQIQSVSSKKLSYKNCLVNTGKILRKVIDQSGNVYEVKNLTEFARQHNLHPSSLSRLLNNKITKTKGWKIFE